MSGQWPPDWEDTDDDVEADAGQADAETNARLSDVTAYLAALPQPVMPETLQARISAAIAAEAADRAEPAGRTLGPPPRRPKVQRSRRFRLQAISSVAACLVLAGFGFLLTRLGGSSSSSSSALSEGAAAPAATSVPRDSENSAASSFGQGNPAPAPAVPSASAPVSFTVISRGDVYQQSTLVSQVRERLAEELNGASTLAGTEYAPTTALIGCIFHVTSNAAPGLVDKASYEGKLVYVIAVPNRAWVVGRGCTAADPELITTVSLAGLHGNLSVLGSVERYAVLRRV
jgi:hypothetical protein